MTRVTAPAAPFRRGQPPLCSAQAWEAIMTGATDTRSAAARILRSATVVAIALALSFGIPPALHALNLHDWAVKNLGPHGFYELYIASGFVLIFFAVMAMWRAGLGRALVELGIARLSPLGCLVCLAAVAAAFGVLLFAGAKWTPQPADSLLIFGVIGPFVEEVLFRGFLFRQMRRWAGAPFWVAAILASLLFGAGHFEQGDSFANAVMNSAITFAGGVLFCWLTERWGSIWPGFAIHAGLNLLWSVYTLGNNAVGGEMGNIARIATIVVGIALTRRLTTAPSTRASG
jgi:membrane protease YdiL (CAAX protease family)